MSIYKCKHNKPSLVSSVYQYNYKHLEGAQ